MTSANITGVATAATKLALPDDTLPLAAQDAAADTAAADSALRDAGLARFFEVLRYTGDGQVNAKSEASSEARTGRDSGQDDSSAETAPLPGMATPMWLGMPMPALGSMQIPVPSASSGPVPVPVQAPDPVSDSGSTPSAMSMPGSGSTPVPIPAPTSIRVPLSTLVSPSPSTGNRPAESDAGTTRPASTTAVAATTPSPTSAPEMATSAWSYDGSATNRTSESPSKKSALPAGLLAALGRDAAAIAGTNGRSAVAATNVASQALTNDPAAMAVWNANPAAADHDQAMTLALPADAPARWRQPLAEALGDRLQLQLGRGSDHAVIRLDPPMLGRIDISIRHDAAGGLQVQLSASNSDVLRQLHALGDTLRQDLVHRQYGEVAVQVSDSRRDGDGRPRPGRPEDEKTMPGRSLTEADTGFAASAFNLTSD